MSLILWIVVIIGYLLAFLSLTYVYVIAFSLFNETPFVPLERKAILYAVKLLNLQADESFIDIGSGDGRVVRIVGKLSPKLRVLVGLEYSYPLHIISRLYASLTNSESKYLYLDAFKYRYSGYNKIFVYLTSDMLDKLLPKIMHEVRIGTRIVSAYFSPTIDIPNASIEVKKSTINGKIKDFYIITKLDEDIRRKETVRKNTNRVERESSK